MKIECADLFLCATQGPTDVYDELIKRDYCVSYVAKGQSSIEDADIIVCDTLSALISVANYIYSDMVVILCDVPLVLSSIPDGNPLDFETPRSFHYRFHHPRYDLIHAIMDTDSKDITPKEINVENFDALGMIIEQSASGDMLLSAFNNVQASFDVRARSTVRGYIIDLLTKDEYKQAFANLKAFLSSECATDSHKKFAKALLQALSKHYKNFRSAVFDVLVQKKAIKPTAKKYDLDVYELTYLIKMISSHEDGKKRERAYNAKVASAKSLGEADGANTQ